jgi:hypothetical protein
MPFHKGGLGKQLADRLGEQAESLPQRRQVTLSLRIGKERPHLVHADGHDGPVNNQFVEATLPKRNQDLRGGIAPLGA